MAGLLPNTMILAFFHTKEALSELPALKHATSISESAVKNAKLNVRINFDETELSSVVDNFRQAGLHVVRYSLTAWYDAAFWTSIPDDCVGGLIDSDGSVSTATDYWTAIPISEPFYTNGRPEMGGEHPTFKYEPYVLGHGGGIPIVSERMLATLRQLGARGETADVIYRSRRKGVPEEVQRGYKRFLPYPQYVMENPHIAILPESAPEQFGVCAMLHRLLTFDSDVNTWYEIALTTELCREIRKVKKRILLAPIFRRGGVMDRWYSEFTAAMKEFEDQSDA